MLRARQAFTALALCSARALLAQGVPACLPGTSVTFGAAGTVQTYPIPLAATRLLVDAAGASGGLSGSLPNQLNGPGGRGFRILAEVPAAAGALAILVGSPGGSGGEVVFADLSGGGGGGGSFVYTTDSMPMLLVAAGGGGGGHSAGSGGDGQDVGTGGSGAPGAAGGSAGAGGSGSQAGGGGGFLTAGGDGSSDPGGHAITGDAAGGQSVFAGDGGFGGGGAGGGRNIKKGGGGGGGGGGGYSGGGGGDGPSPGTGAGGGGSSFVAPGGATFLHAVTPTVPPNSSGIDGAITICATAVRAPSVIEVPTLGGRELGVFAALLALLAVARLRR